MRWTASLRVLLCLLLLVLPVRPQIPTPLARCGPRTTQGEWPQNLPPSEQSLSDIFVRPTVDMAQLQHDAKELADLSASVPADINRVNRGLLPKDVIEKLRRIEKLSKRLRTGLTQ